MKPGFVFRTALLFTLFVPSVCTAQTLPQLKSIPALPFPSGALTISQAAVPNRPFTVTGTGGAILGMQDGTAELWQFPLKFFSGLQIQAEVDGYPVPINLNADVATLQVSPDHSTLTYAHSAIVVRQHMFVPAGEGNQGLGGVIVFEIQSIAPVTLTVSLTPSMVLQWPAPQYGQPSWDWLPGTTSTPAEHPAPIDPATASGIYGVYTDNPELWGLIGLAGSTPGNISPYQEHPRTLPLQFRLRFDPKKNSGQMYPLLCEIARPGEKNSDATQAALRQRLVDRAAALPTIWSHTQQYYAHFFDTRLTAQTPDPHFDQALAWAELAIDKAQVATSTGEVGLIAGWYPSFDSARPGFGWFFGRDTLWSSYAINAYGDPALTRRALDFLIARQRPDGKMMHEFSQTAGLLTGTMAWSNFPYEYAAADSTPLYLLAMQDYVRATGDMAYLKKNWDSLQRAYHFERTHDSDGDGVYDNSQGTGWVEGWPPRLPHQELYLAALDRDATSAMAQLASWMNDAQLAQEARATAQNLTKSVEAYRLPNGQYAFSRNADGTYDPTLTVYPSVALWSSSAGLAQPQIMLIRWSAHLFSTDWGARAVSSNDPVYDPISYHQGTVWPLFTGWTAMAEYRGNRPLAGLASLQRNIDLTWAQDPGAVTEVLSGRFYEPLGRSSTHQLWSSAMVLSPAIKGLFGVEPDAPNHALILHPSLPATWDRASLSNLLIGDDRYSLTLERQSGSLTITATSAAPTVLCLRAKSAISVTDDPIPCAEKPSTRHELKLPLAPVELQLLPPGKPEFGDETRLPRVIDEHADARSLTIQVEAHAGSTVSFAVRTNAKVTPTSSEELRDGKLQVVMPPQPLAATDSFITKEVTIRW